VILSTASKNCEAPSQRLGYLREDSTVIAILMKKALKFYFWKKKEAKGTRLSLKEYKRAPIHSPGYASYSTTISRNQNLALFPFLLS